MIKNLDMSYLEIGVFSVTVSLSAFAAYRFWGTAIDRVGNRSVLIICTVIIISIPLFWLTPQVGAIWPVWLIGIWAGIGWSGFNLTAFNLPIVLSPRGNRSFYLAVYSSATGLAVFVSGTLGGLLANSLAGMETSINGYGLVNYHVIFVISAVLRLSSLVWLKRVKETRDVGVPVLLQFMGRAAAHRLTVGGVLFPYRFAKRLAGSVKNAVKRGSG
jgi:MFS family permease